MADSYEWPKSLVGKKLGVLEESMVCAICSDFYTNPHSLNCGHSYCSACIRKHLDRNFNSFTSSQCPSCREKAETSHLRPNRVLALVISSFKSCRNDLLDITKSTSLVINDHPDDNIEFPNLKRIVTKVTDVKYLPQKVFYKYSKDKIKKEIETLCKSSSVELNMDGSSEDLEKRYRELVILNNAQLNSPSPLSFSECVKEINRREQVLVNESRSEANISSKIEKIKNHQPTSADDQFKEMVKNLRKKSKSMKLENQINSENPSLDTNSSPLNNYNICSNSTSTSSSSSSSMGVTRNEEDNCDDSSNRSKETNHRTIVGITNITDIVSMDNITNEISFSTEQVYNNIHDKKEDYFQSNSWNTSHDDPSTSTTPDTIQSNMKNHLNRKRSSPCHETENFPSETSSRNCDINNRIDSMNVTATNHSKREIYVVKGNNSYNNSSSKEENALSEREKMSNQPLELIEINSDDEEESEVISPSTNISSCVSGFKNIWKCSYCTFRNSTDQRYCEVCKKNRILSIT